MAYTELRRHLFAVELTTVVVDPTHRGRGLCHALMEAAVQSTEARPLILFTRAPALETAVARLGFEQRRPPNPLTLLSVGLRALSRCLRMAAWHPQYDDDWKCPNCGLRGDWCALCCPRCRELRAALRAKLWKGSWSVWPLQFESETEEEPASSQDPLSPSSPRDAASPASDVTLVFGPMDATMGI